MFIYVLVKHGVIQYTMNFKKKGFSMKNFTNASIVAATVLVLTACGGGGGSNSTSTESTESTVSYPPLTGQFIDSYVTGLAYDCSSGSKGVTNETGEYTCNSRDTVTFLLGKYMLGSCEANEIVTPYTLYTYNSSAAINVAQLLQTIDSDDDPSNGITVPEGFSELDSITVRPTDDTFDEAIQAALSKKLLNGRTAQNHLNGTLNLPSAGTGYTANWLEGRTLYSAIKDSGDADNDGGTTDWVLRAEKYENGYRSLDLLADGTFETADDTFEIINGVLNINEGAVLLTKTVIAADMVRISQRVTVDGNDTNKTEYEYYKKDEAQAYIVQMSYPCKCGVFTDIFIEGNTLYSVIKDTQDHDNDGSTTDWILLAEKYENGHRLLDYTADGVYEVTTDTYEIIDGILKISRGDTWITKTISEVSAIKITETVALSSGEADKTVYEFYNKADAEVYLNTF
jgi:hypothetical protein